MTSIAYFREPSSPLFWSSHWERQSLMQLVAVAEVSPLSTFLARHIEAGDDVIEAGCGLGQYVHYFSRRGANIVGVDFSRSALATHRAAFPESNLVVADLTDLPFEASSFDAYISLGVIEHCSDGGHAILEEAGRVLRKDGRLLLSTPYVNMTRRVLRRHIVRRQQALALAGAGFYQYAFDELALDGILKANGFVVAERSYYNPGRGLRDLIGAVRTQRLTAPSSEALQRMPSNSTPNAVVMPRHAIIRKVLDSRLTLKLLAHMQVVYARKSS